MHISKSLESNLWILDGCGNSWKYVSVFCMMGARRTHIIMELGATSVATLEEDRECSIIFLTDDNDVQHSHFKSAIRRSADYNYTWCAIFIDSGNNLLSLVEVSQFHRQLAGFPRSSLYMSRLGLGGMDRASRGCDGDHWFLWRCSDHMPL